MNTKIAIWIFRRGFFSLFSQPSLLLFFFILNYLLATFLHLSSRRRRRGLCLQGLFVLFFSLSFLFCESLGLLILFLFLFSLFLCESCCTLPFLSNLDSAHLSQISYCTSILIRCIAGDLDNFRNFQLWYLEVWLLLSWSFRTLTSSRLCRGSFLFWIRWRLISCLLSSLLLLLSFLLLPFGQSFLLQFFLLLLGLSFEKLLYFLSSPLIIQFKVLNGLKFH